MTEHSMVEHCQYISLQYNNRCYTQFFLDGIIIGDLVKEVLVSKKQAHMFLNRSVSYDHALRSVL